jgi:protein-disulfide isomerase
LSFATHSVFGRAAFAALVLATAVMAAPRAHAQKVVAAPEVSVEELMKPSDPADVAAGKADAPVTIVEYSSMTCPHCATFATKVLPKIKEKYIDTGKVRFISRDFPLDNLAAAAAMLTHCVDTDKAFAFSELLFATQSKWAADPQTAVANLFDIAKQAGFSKESFEKCLTDQVLLDKITSARTRAGEKFQINSTPTFFLNGKRMAAGTFEDFEKAIEPLLGAK